MDLCSENLVDTVGKGLKKIALILKKKNVSDEICYRYYRI